MALGNGNFGTGGTGGTISGGGTGVADDLTTTETNTLLSLKPDGLGGVTWSEDLTGSGGAGDLSLYLPTTEIAGLTGNLQGQITSNDSDITGLRTDVDAISADLDTHEADTSIHLTSSTLAGVALSAGADDSLNVQADESTITVIGGVVADGSTNASTTDVTTIGFAYATSFNGGGSEAYRAFDEIYNNYNWISLTSESLPQSVGQDFGVGNEKVINKVRLTGRLSNSGGDGSPINIKVRGSTDFSSWTDLTDVADVGVSPTDPATFGAWVTFVNDVAYRYVEIQVISSDGNSYAAICEIQMVEAETTQTQLSVTSSLQSTIASALQPSDIVSLTNDVATISGDLDTHEADLTIHYTQTAISISASQIVDLPATATIETITTSETATALVLKPDGTGGVEWGIDVTSSGAGGSAVEDLTTTETNDVLVLKPDGIGGVVWAVDLSGGDATDLSNYLTTPEIAGLTGDLQTQITDHEADSSIHFTQGSISITESQISDHGNYAEVSLVANISGDLQTQITTNDSDITGLRTDVDTVSGDFDIHVANSDIHYTVESINISASQIVDLPATTVSNIGISGFGLYKQTVGDDLQFKNIDGDIHDFIEVLDDVASDSLQIGLSDNAKNMMRFSTGALLEQTEVLLTSDGVNTITLSVGKAGGAGDLTAIFGDGFHLWETTTPVTIDIPEGTRSAPLTYYVYLLNNSGVLTLTRSAVSFPTTSEYCPIATVVVASAVLVDSEGAYKLHAWVDHMSSSVNNGHLSHLNEWIRAQPATWIDGVATTLVGSGTASITLATASGNVRQLHDHSFPAFVANSVMYAINNVNDPYQQETLLSSFNTLDDGTTTVGNNKFTNLVVWGVVSEADTHATLFVNLPSGEFSNINDAKNDAGKLTNYTIPSDYVGTGFLISKVTLKISGSNFIVSDEVDLRGQIPSVLTSSGNSIATTIENITTTETTTTLVLKPDGIGGVEWGIDMTSSGGGSVAEDLTTSETNTDLVLKPDGIGGVTWTADLSGNEFDDSNVVHLTGAESISGQKTFEDVIVHNANLIPGVTTLVGTSGFDVDAEASREFALTLTENAILNNPTNATDGMKLLVKIKQDGTGNHVLSLDTQYKEGDLAFSITALSGASTYAGFQFDNSVTQWNLIALQGGF